ncbi:MAG: hypothetical protein Q4B52_07835 [Tissierellia bacterium]|nr:hypothetical protein [Tissierellia bacterium]
MKTDFKKVMVIAGSYVATLIGSGYATGQEIMQFFVFYGLGAIIVSLIVMAIYSLLAIEVLERGRLVKPTQNTKIFQFYAGKYLGTFFEYFALLFLFGVVVVMVSGAGDTLNEYYGLNRYVGRIFVAVCMFLTVSGGLKKLVNIIGNIGPVIIIFTIAISLYSLFSTPLSDVKLGSEFIQNASVQRPVANPIMAGFNYASFNVIVVIAYLSGLGRVNTRKENVLGGLIGGITLGITALIMALAMLSKADIIYQNQVPALVLADNLSPIVGKFFSVILFLGIYTTAVTLNWQISDKFVSEDSPNFKYMTLFVSVLAFFCGFVPFDKLVSTIYPYTGYVGLILLALMLIKAIKLKNVKDGGYEEMRQIEESLKEYTNARTEVEVD